MSFTRRGQYRGAGPLHPTSTATSVRVPATIDGWSPTARSAETREQLGGYFLVDAKDLDEAIAIAGRIPMARSGTIEIRPVIDMPEYAKGFLTSGCAPAYRFLARGVRWRSASSISAHKSSRLRTRPGQPGMRSFPTLCATTTR